MQTAELLGYRLRFEQQGSGDAAVVLLGGLAVEAGTWAAQVEALRSACRVIAIDPPAAGSAPGAGSTEGYADAVAAFLRELGVGPVHAVGADLGGAIAQQLALRHRELVRSLALHGGFGRADRHLAAILRAWQRSAQVLAPLDLARQTWPFLFTVWWFNDRPDEQAALEREIAARADGWRADEFSARIDACLAHDALDRLYEIEAPTLITVGDRDVLTPAHHAYAMRERMPGARMRVWQKMGHSPYREIPQEFARVTLDWIREH